MGTREERTLERKLGSGELAVALYSAEVGVKGEDRQTPLGVA